MSARSQFLAAAMEITNRQTCECRNLSPIEMVEVMERCAGDAPIGRDDVYLVWSNEHGAWWGMNQSGYFTKVEAAGRYSLEEARECCGSRSRCHSGLAPEVMITERNAIAGIDPNHQS